VSAVHIHLDGPQRGARVNWPWIGYVAEKIVVLIVCAAFGMLWALIIALAFIAAGGSL
jgi:hypothetical protein